MAKDYNALFKQGGIQGALNFVNTYSCNPDSELAGVHGDLDPAKFNVKTKSKTDYYLKTMGNADKIGYLDFQKQSHKTGTEFDISGQIKVTGNYTPDPTKVAAYFLPWETEHVISLTIPPMLAHRQGVPYFFTAAINGCSVFVKGTPRNPTVYHAGGKTGYEHDPKKGARFWQNLLEKHALTRSKTAGKTQGEVNKVDYTVDKVSVSQFSAGINVVTKLGTANSRLFEDWLKQTSPGDCVIEDVAPTGCVFGLRNTVGDWSFYLQENATIRYHKFTLDATGHNLVKTTRSAMRPMQVTQFYPGRAHAQFQPNLTRVLKGAF